MSMELSAAREACAQFPKNVFEPVFTTSENDEDFFLPWCVRDYPPERAMPISTKEVVAIRKHIENRIEELRPDEGDMEAASEEGAKQEPVGLVTNRLAERAARPNRIRHACRAGPSGEQSGHGDDGQGDQAQSDQRRAPAEAALVPPRAARALGLRILRAEVKGRDLVLEGGSIDVNGRGTLITTEECLLDPVTQVRNPGLTRAVVETALRDYLGVTNILWLGRGIAGDDTHGHVDDLSRFVGPRTVVLCQEKNSSDPNFQVLEENRERLESMRLEDGSRIEVVPLPMPAPLYIDGQRLPVSYANFYISNAAALVPTFNDPNDRIALGTLAELIRDRPVIGIHAVDLVWGLGTLHCLTHEQPAPVEADGGGPSSCADGVVLPVD